MDILFRGRKLEKICNDQVLLVRTHGPIRARLLRRRLDELRAMENLEGMRSLPQVKCHELKGDREGQLAVNLDHPFRMILEPANDPVPKKLDGGLDWVNVTAVRVLAVENYHD